MTRDSPPVTNVTVSGVHTAGISGLTRPGVPGLMIRVMIALVPGTALLTWSLGTGVLINVLACILFAWLFEAVAVRSRRRSVRHALSDGSITLAAWLLALALPPFLPLWQIGIGAMAMAWLGKHLYGGLGHNPFNPAMTGYAVLIVSFPVTMTTWPASDAATWPDLLTLLHLKLLPGAALASPGGDTWEAMSGATPLDHLRSIKRSDDAAPLTSASMNALILDGAFVPANVAFLIGGLYLLWQRVIRWHIPVAILGSLVVLHALQAWFSDDPRPAIWLTLLSGALVLGAFFIATDPVSAATANRGRLVYGVGIGVLSFVIREFGGYPEGLAFAVLIMNSTVPAIDQWSTTRR